MLSRRYSVRTRVLALCWLVLFLASSPGWAQTTATKPGHRIVLSAPAEQAAVSAAGRRASPSGASSRIATPTGIADDEAAGVRFEIVAPSGMVMAGGEIRPGQSTPVEMADPLSKIYFEDMATGQFGIVSAPTDAEPSRALMLRPFAIEDSMDAHSRLLKQRLTGGEKPKRVPQELVVGFPTTTLLSERIALHQRLHAIVLDYLPMARAYRVILAADQDAGTAASEYRARGAKVGEIGFLQPDAPRVIPSDASFADGLQWGLDEPGDRDVDAPEAWAQMTGASEVVVAVIDMGVDYTNNDLNDVMWNGVPNHGRSWGPWGCPNEVLNNPMPDDVWTTVNDPGHGTHVAGIIAAEANNAQVSRYYNTVGVAWNARIMALRLCEDNSFMTSYNCAQALEYAVAHGAQVVNMSIGWDDDYWYLHEDIATVGRTVVLVAAAGNEHSSAALYPAAYPGVISVGGAQQTGHLLWWDDAKPDTGSNYGPNLSVVAPAKDIWSTYWKNGSSDAYWELTGTSMAAPMVSGIAAMVRGKYPSLNTDEVRQRIEDAATYVEDPNGDGSALPGPNQYSGHGLVNAFRAIMPDGSSLAADSIPLGRRAGVFDYPTDVDAYRFHVAGRAKLQLKATDLPSKAFFELYDANDVLVAAGGNTTTGTETYNVPVEVTTGDYVVKLTDQSSSMPAPDGYWLYIDSYESNDTFLNAVSILSGNTYDSALGEVGDVDIYKFTVPAASHVSVTAADASGSSALDLTLGIYNSSQSPIEVINAHGPSGSETYDNGALAAGTYYVVITAGADHGRGGYRLTLAVDGPPGVAATTPRNNATSVSANTAMTVTFSRAIDPVTLTSSNIQVVGSTFGAYAITSPASYDAASRTAAVRTLSNFAQNERITVTLTSGITDMQGRGLDGNGDGVAGGNYAWGFNTVATSDLVPPKVSPPTTPTAGAVNIAQNSTILVTFNEAMNAGTFAQGNITVVGSQSGSITWTCSYDTTYRRLTITPTTLFSGDGETITVTVRTACTDLAGNGLDGNGDGTVGPDFTLTFTTVNVLPPPQPVITSVVTGNTQVTVNWSALTAGDLAGYELYRTEPPSGTLTTVSTAIPASAVNWPVTGLQNFKHYKFFLRAKDTKSPTPNYSPYSNGVLGVPEGAGPTSVSGSTGAEWTWKAVGSPFVVTSTFQVTSAGSLTIDPGAVVRVAPNASVTVDGDLQAVGTQALPIVFTSRDDNAEGGAVTGSDGVPAAGDWAGVHLRGSGTSRLKWCRVKYATDGVSVEATGSSQSLTPSITNCDIRDLSGNGIVVSATYSGVNAAPSVSACTVRRAGSVGSGKAGIYCYSTSDATALCAPTLSDVTVEDVDYSLWCVNNAFPTVTNLTRTRDRYPAVAVNGTVSRAGQYPAVAGLPYLVHGSLTIDAAGTLTFPASAVVKFDDSGMLYVYGTLALQGGQGTETTLTSWRDDAVGGDTNGNGSATVPSAGVWGGIRLYGPSASGLHDCVIKYPDYGVYVASTASGQTVSPAITRCTIQDTQYDGVQLSADNSTSAVGSAVSTCTVRRTGSTYAGLHCTATSSTSQCVPTLSDVTVEDVDYSLRCDGNAFPTVTNLTRTRDRYPAVAVSGTVSRVGQYPAVAGLPYLVHGSLTIDAAGTLTFPASAVVKFDDSGGLYVYGTLVLQGGQGTETTLTSWRDDAVGGDTNGNGSATVPSAGIWAGITLYASQASNLQDCVIRYPTRGIYVVSTGSGQTILPSLTRCAIQDAANAGISLSSSYANTSLISTIDHCTITRAGAAGSGEAIECYAGSYSTASVTPSLVHCRMLDSYDGLLVRNASSATCLPTITACSFEGNTHYAVENTVTTTTVNATGCWWGDATGPYHATSNPGGLGDPVSDRVTFSGWLSSDPNLAPPAATASLAAAGVHLTGLGSSRLDWGDYTGDGVPDLVVCGLAGTTRKCLLYKGDGSGGLVPDPQTLTGVTPGAVKWIDVDGDHTLELFVAGTTVDSGAVFIYENAGSGTLTRAATSSFPKLTEYSAAWADFDNDGKPDLLLAGKQTGGTAYTGVFRNKGAFQFQEYSAGITAALGVTALAEDVDGDGDVDVALFGGRSGSLIAELYLNDGTGHFTLASNPGLLPMSGVAGDWGDCDQDGLPDLFVSGTSATGPVTRLYRNLGSGVFAADGALTSSALGTGAAALGDHDNNGMFDVYLTGVSIGGTVSSQLWKTTAPSQYSLSTTQVLPTWGGAVAWCDLDQDGDLDLAVSGRTAIGADTTVLYLSNAASVSGANTVPTPPTTITSNLRADSTSADLSWSAGSDAKTGAGSLTYEIRIGTTSGASDVYCREAHAGAQGVARQGTLGTAHRFSTSSLQPGSYYWSVRAVDSGFMPSAWSSEGTFVITKLSPTAVDEPGSLAFGIRSIRPNPARGAVCFEVAPGDRGPGLVQILDVTGRVRRTIPAGRWGEVARVVWDGIDAHGERVPPGIYFVRLMAGGRSAERKLVVLR